MKLWDFITGKTNNDVDAVFENNKNFMNASDAYSRSRFGTVKNEKQLLEEFFSDVRYLTDTKTNDRSYCGMVEVNSDIVHFMPKIIDRLVKTNGYKVIVLNDDSVIHNTVTGTTDTVKTGRTFIMLFWDKNSLQEVQELNNQNVNESGIDGPADDTVQADDNNTNTDVPEPNSGDPDNNTESGTEVEVTDSLAISGNPSTEEDIKPLNS